MFILRPRIFNSTQATRMEDPTSTVLHRRKENKTKKIRTNLSTYIFMLQLAKEIDRLLTLIENGNSICVRLLPALIIRNVITVKHSARLLRHLTPSISESN